MFLNNIMYSLYGVEKSADRIVVVKGIDNIQKPAYVGVIGSRKKAAGVRKMLKEEHGLSEEELNIVTTPIGMEIDAETPAEIAVSIAGQMIQVRARRNKG